MSKNLIVIFLLVVFSNTKAQTVILDLGEKNHSKKAVKPGTVQIILLNAIPTKIYKTSVVIKNRPPKHLPIEGLGITGAVGAAPTPNLDDETICIGGPALKRKINSILNKTSESEMKKTYEEAKAEVDKLSAGKCKTEATQLLQEKDNLRRKNSFVQHLRYNQTANVTVERYSADNETLEEAWNVVLETEDEASRWLIYYGFTYQPNVISKYDTYFSKADTSTANKYTITKRNGNQTSFWENLSPTIMFTLPFSSNYSDFLIGASIIASTNFSTFSAGAGLSAIIGYNANLSTGVMFTQKNVLNGNYIDGEIIKQNLSFDQLHEKKWGPEFFFTIAIRFDKNPFSGKAGAPAAPSGTNTGNNSGGSSGSGSNTDGR